MKKSITFVCALTALLTSCKVLEIKIVYSLSVNTTSITLASNETTTQTVTVTTDANSWDATTKETWLSIGKEGNRLNITPTTNAETTERTATITVTAATAPAVTVTVTQAGANTLSVNPSSISFEANESGTKTVTITTNAASWDATTTSTWLTIGKQGTTLQFTVSENTETSGRAAIVTITAGTATPVTIMVTQGEAFILSVSPTSFSFEARETTPQTATITTNATNWDATTTASWLTIEKLGTTLQLTPTANTETSDRLATINVTADPADPVIVTVSQEGANSLSVNTATISYTANETTNKTITVTTNAPSWDYTSDASWLTVVKENNILRFILNEFNTGTSQRSAIVNITAGTANPVTVTVTQPVTTMRTMTMTTAKNEVTIELRGTGTPIIFWGDGTSPESKSVSSITSTVFTHNYSNSTSRDIMVAGSNILYLSSEDNQLTNLDIYNNKSLTELHCRGNRLTNLDMSNNTALTYFDCGDNQLTILNVEKNIALSYLGCYGNQLTNLDVRMNTKLINFRCGNNNLSNLDVSTNVLLTSIECFDNQLKNIDISKNTALITLHCYNNQLSSLDVSKNTALRLVRIQNNYMNAGALNSLFETLHSNSGTKTIYISQNGPNGDGTGTDGCNQSIATNKGWTVYPPITPISWQIGSPISTNVTATFDNGTLTIRGTGAVRSEYALAPWMNLVNNDIKNAIIESGVTNIGDWYFYECNNLTSVFMANTVKQIGNQAFRGCRNLSSITIPNSVTYIGTEAFLDCGLTSIDIPSSVTTIEGAAFRRCVHLTDVTVNWETPLIIESVVFLEVPIANIRLHVPEGSYDLYASSPVWKEFNIVKP